MEKHMKNLKLLFKAFWKVSGPILKELLNLLVVLVIILVLFSVEWIMSMVAIATLLFMIYLLITFVIDYFKNIGKEYKELKNKF